MQLNLFEQATIIRPIQVKAKQSNPVSRKYPKLIVMLQSQGYSIRTSEQAGNKVYHLARQTSL